MAAPRTAAFVDHGGPVLQMAQVYLLYWGRAWTDASSYSPTPGQITIAVQTMLARPYLSGLAQYRAIRPAVLRAARVVTTSQPHSGFTDDDGQRIRFAWTADSGNLTDATRAISHELVEAVTDPDGDALRGVSGTCRQSGWCEIADICSDIGVIDDIAVSPYWSDRAHSCVTPDQARTEPTPPACTSHACESELPQPSCGTHRREADPECR
jgi:hypothetical protein